MEDHKKFMAYRIVQERLVTSKKNENKIVVDYKDNGIGINKEALILKNVLQNEENRNEAIKGTINFDATSGKGFKVNFSFPV